MTEGYSAFDTLTEEFGWPPAEVLFAPLGSSPELFARLAREKIGAALTRMAGYPVETGVIVADPESASTEAPLAVICHFPRKASGSLLAEAQRLAWNFCHAPVLVTVDPYEIRTWSCFVAPSRFLGQDDASDAELTTHLVLGGEGARSPSAVALQWLRIVAGELVSRDQAKFRPEGRADRLLLENLKAVRRRLLSGPGALAKDLAHDLIARLMFLQFLFDRKDNNGVSALNADRLAELKDNGTLRAKHKHLSDVLADFEDTYSLFSWLDARFNGDFWPAKSSDPASREAEWAEEKRQVLPEHLQLLSDLVAGTLEVDSGQRGLWRLYSFDTIPLEFVSSIYEEFVSAPQDPALDDFRKTNYRDPGVHYTPTHLVDFVLDGVLPWEGTEWKVRVLDPACGSGIFLVRAFQRLVNRWRNANPGLAIGPDILGYLLENCIFGIEINPHAARVASFSLYLAMCDELDPRRYWTDTHFPPLRGKRILVDDFFSDDTTADGLQFDIVVGNAPWGIKTMTAAGTDWAAANAWPIMNKDLGTLFLGRALEHLCEGGKVAMIQSAGSLLLNEGSAEARRKLFAVAKVEEIVNFTVLRRQLFPSAESPACSVVLSKSQPDGSPTTYICPKLLHTGEDGFRIAIDDLDVNLVYPEEVEQAEPWMVLMAGSRRDLDLVRAIRAQRGSLRGLLKSGDLIAREGVIPGKTSPEHEGLVNRRVLYDKSFPEGTDLYLDGSVLPRMETIRTHRRTDPRAFQLPQLIVKQAWSVAKQRFSAVMVTGSEGIVCNQSYLSVHAVTETGHRAIKVANVVFNGKTARYLMTMSNPRMAYRSEMRVKDLLQLPLPDFLAEARSIAPGEDDLTLFALKEPDRALIDDALTYGVPEMLGHRQSPGRKPTSRQKDGQDDVAVYARQYMKVFGSDPDTRRLSSTVFTEGGSDPLPVRILAIHFVPLEEGIVFRTINSAGLEEVLRKLGKAMDGGPGKFAIRRVATIFDTVVDPGTGAQVPTVFLVRPDQKRFWTRAAAMRDADRMVVEGVPYPAAEPHPTSGRSF